MYAPGAEPNTAQMLDQLERLAEYSPLVGGYGLTLLTAVRERQDWRLNERLCRNAVRTVQSEKLIHIEGDDFFVGSVDFMVRESNGDLSYVVLEANGGSHRGYTSLSPHSLAQIGTGYQEMLRFASDTPPLVVIGHPSRDPLLLEKIYLAQHLSQVMVEMGLCTRSRITRMDGFRGLQEPDEGLIVLESYDSLMPALVGADRRIILNGQKVDLIIGDGVARRHMQMGQGERFDLVLANWSFPVTDDKYLTYHAVEMVADLLEPFQVDPIGFWRAQTVEELIALCEEHRADRDLIIKPFQGSGGSGVHPIDGNTPLEVVLEESMGEYREKFGSWRSPFPYTVCEKVNPHQARWRDSDRNFDIRVYVARDGDQLIPVGGLIRIALEPDTGGNRKRALVVNLSGYGGVDTDRGLGISEETLRITGLDEGDFSKMFAAAAVLLTFVAKNVDAIRERA